MSQFNAADITNPMLILYLRWGCCNEFQSDCGNVRPRRGDITVARAANDVRNPILSQKFDSGDKMIPTTSAENTGAKNP